MTRPAGFAFSFAGAIVAFWFISRTSLAAATGADAITVWNVTVIMRLTLFAAFITAALIAHVQPDGMSRGRRVAWRAGAIGLAIAAAVLAPQIVVIAAAGYVVFVLASDVRRRRQQKAT
jgi:hypothetical protein